MCFAIAFIDAAAVDELLEIGFIRPFVDGQAAFHALEVPSRLLECVLVRSLWVLLLDFKELLDGAGPCELLPNRFVRAEIRLWCFVDQEFTVLLEMLFNDFHRKSLMDSGNADRRRTGWHPASPKDLAMLGVRELQHPWPWSG